MNEIYFTRIESKSLEQLQGLLIKVNILYESTEEDSDKIKLLGFIGELEEKIRCEEFKERLMNGEE